MMDEINTNKVERERFLITILKKDVIQQLFEEYKD